MRERRVGPSPQTTLGTPHTQLDQPTSAALQATLWARMAALDGMRVRPSAIGPVSSRAVELTDHSAAGPDEAFLSGREFAHLHGDGSGSLLLALPAPLATRAITDGWAIRHPCAGTSFLPATAVMVFGPRDNHELETIWDLVQSSYLFARGPSPQPTIRG